MFSKLKITALIIWSAFLILYWATGKIPNYLHPDYYWLPILGGILLFLMAGIWGIQIILKKFNKKIFIPNIVKSKTSENVFLFVLFMYPILFNLIVNPQGLASNDLAVRGEDTVSSYINFYPPSEYESKLNSVPEDEYLPLTLLELSYESYLNPQEMDGRKIDVVGFMYSSHDTKHPINISRFVIVCCAADAIPLAFSIDPAMNSPHIRQDIWMRVRGMADVDTLKQKVYIVMDDVNTVKKPENQYLFAD
jgi:uncharacterized repeat protein (TIGR03943 family)